MGIKTGCIAALCALLLSAPLCGAYSVLTHEEIIDLAWNDCIRPLLLAKYPGATENQLRIAHAYAYGGSAIQDMGYYPFGKPFFSNLTHYVRTGDFIAWMFDNARNINEYAFAIGALSHYLGDSIGHSEVINPATAVEFPKLERKFGPRVTYGESPHGHIRTEFAFDIDEMTSREFAPPPYMEAVGFKVPARFLERAFVNTYGIPSHEVLGPAHPALRSYRIIVRRFIPIFAEAEVVLHRRQFPPHPDDEAYRIFSTRVARTNYERRWKKWQHAYRGPGIKAHLLAGLIFIIPKVGPVSDLAIKIPTPETEEWYLRSVNNTVDAFRETLQTLADSNGSATLVNLDLDTGRRARIGDYALADQTYETLLARLSAKPERSLPEGLKRNILQYYSGAAGSPMERVQQQLAVLETMRVTSQIRTSSRDTD